VLLQLLPYDLFSNTSFLFSSRTKRKLVPSKFKLKKENENIVPPRGKKTTTAQQVKSLVFFLEERGEFKDFFGAEKMCVCVLPRICGNRTVEHTKPAGTG